MKKTHKEISEEMRDKINNQAWCDAYGLIRTLEGMGYSGRMETNLVVEGEQIEIRLDF